MLSKAKKLKNFTLKCIDGEIGKVKDFYFDDQDWNIRYLRVNTGNWLFGRQVLVSPFSIASVNFEEEYITTNLTKDQIENSPNLESEKPVSEQFQKAFNNYYAFPLYAGGMRYAGNMGNPGVGTILPIKPIETKNDTSMFNFQDENGWDPHLRSMDNVNGYGIQAIEDDFGHVADFIIDVETWSIHYLEIDTSNWLPGKKVLLSPEWISQINWGESLVFVNLSSDQIKKSPEYTEDASLDRDYETRLHEHYNQKGYWLE